MKRVTVAVLCICLAMLCACTRAAETAGEITSAAISSPAQSEANRKLDAKAFIAAAQEAQTPDDITALLDHVDAISDEALLAYEDSLYRVADEFSKADGVRSVFPGGLVNRSLFKLGLQHFSLLHYGIEYQVDYIALRVALEGKITGDGAAYLEEQILNEHNTYMPGNTDGYYTIIAHNMERKSIFENKHPAFLKRIEANGYKHYSHSAIALGYFLLEDSGEEEGTPVGNERRQQFIEFLDFEKSRLTGGFSDPAINIPCVYGKDVEKAVGLLEANGWVYTNDIRNQIYDIVAVYDPNYQNLPKPWLEADLRLAELKAKEGILPDKDVEAFMEFLKSVREAYNSIPFYGIFAKDPGQNALEWFYSVPGGGYFIRPGYDYLIEQLQGRISQKFIEAWSNVEYDDCGA